MQENPNSRTYTEPLVAFEFSVVSGPLAVRQALGALLDALSPLDLEAEDKGTIELVLAEALNNIVEHAYPPSVSPGQIMIKCELQANGLMVGIKDHGNAMPDVKLPAGALASLDVELDDMPEGGFGSFLIQHLAKDVSYVRNGNENLLKMRLTVGLGSQ